MRTEIPADSLAETPSDGSIHLEPGDTFADLLGHRWTVIRAVYPGWQYLAEPFGCAGTIVRFGRSDIRGRA